MFLVMIVCSFVAGDVSSFGKRFLFRIIFRRGFSSDFLAGNCLLKDFFGRDFSSYFFAENVSSEFPW